MSGATSKKSSLQTLTRQLNNSFNSIISVKETKMEPILVLDLKYHSKMVSEKQPKTLITCLLSPLPQLTQITNRLQPQLGVKLPIKAVNNATVTHARATILRLKILLHHLLIQIPLNTQTLKKKKPKCLRFWLNLKRNRDWRRK
jgi:hypothetical protein